MNTISGLSFYDSLNKMIIGTLVLLLVKDMPSEDDGKSIFLFIVAAFIIGCIFQMVVQFITGNTLLSKGIKIGFKTFFAHDYSWLHKINDLFNLTNNKTLIKEACNDLYGKDYIDETYKNIKNDNYISEYYLAYYRVAKNNILMNIPILEALENFMRNLIFFFTLYEMLLLGRISISGFDCSFYEKTSCAFLQIFTYGSILFIILLFGIYILSYLCKKCRNLCFIGINLLIFVYLLGILYCGYICKSFVDYIFQEPCYRLTLCVVATFIACWLRKEIQYKIHYLIWEGDYYIRLLDNTPNGQTNNATPSNNIPNGQANNGSKSNKKKTGQTNNDKKDNNNETNTIN